MIEGVIFDADGTLLDSTDMWLNAAALYLKTLEIEAEPNLGKILFAMTLQDGAAYLKEVYQLSHPIEEIMEGVNGTIARFYREEVTLKPGVQAFLEGLSQRQIPMTLATATDRVLIESGLHRTGIFDYFQGIFTCGEVGKGKDEPDIYLAAQMEMGTSRKATWVFEDAVHGAKTAKKAGFLVAGVYDPVSHGEQAALRRLSHIYLETFGSFDHFYRQACLV